MRSPFGNTLAWSDIQHPKHRLQVSPSEEDFYHQLLLVKKYRCHLEKNKRQGQRLQTYVKLEADVNVTMDKIVEEVLLCSGMKHGTVM